MLARFPIIAGTVAVVALSIAWFGLASQPTLPAQAVMTTTVYAGAGGTHYSNTSMMNNCGNPCVTNINPGDTVHWVWQGSTHSATSDNGSAQVWDSGEHGTGATFDVTFLNAGTYSYHCTVHGSAMRGTIIVGLAPGARNGDVNCSGGADAIDAALMLQLGAGLVGSLSCQQNGDVNGDYQINSIDAALVLQFSAGLIGHLPT